MADEKEQDVIVIEDDDDDDDDEEKWLKFRCILLQYSTSQPDTVVKKYSNGKSNLESLKSLGATIIHGVDATKMKRHTDLGMRQFDRIIFNFPHAGFHGKEDHVPMILKHRNLVRGFFKNASGMLRSNGEVHVNHKTTAPFNQWNLEELASIHKLRLIEHVEFKKDDYPGYNNKRGDSARCDEPFPLGECETFKFQFVHNLKKKMTQALRGIGSTEQTQKVPEIQIHNQYHGLSNTGSSQPVSLPSMHNPRTLSTPPINPATNDSLWIFHEYFRNTELMYGRTGYDVRQVTQETLRAGFDRYMTGALRRDVNGFIMLLRDLHRLSTSRLEWLQRSLIREETKGLQPFFRG
ncbi:hypothetical protein IFM89_010026 [Coptis chinensis]|uniref:25S rRNA (uridine-N(3))-methyltransferase BMT5-like domain-containing protein n=1 Tax=Coptis chinensis TaxID=261450 RepID=A0A835HJP4_9MAGN|nr:hypothetical protein IFM89_010026 [Coptis chinensis]